MADRDETKSGWRERQAAYAKARLDTVNVDPFRAQARAVLVEAGVDNIETVLLKLTMAFADTAHERYQHHG